MADYTTFLPEKLLEQYKVKQTATTTLEKVLELFSQIMSGEVSSDFNFDEKLSEIINFWDAYKQTDLEKLKRVLDSQGISETIAEVNEDCNLGAKIWNERAYLMMVPSFNKMKGTLGALQNVLSLFDITLTIVPWYDPNFPPGSYEPCTVHVTAKIEYICTTVEFFTTIRDIIRTLLDVCAIMTQFNFSKEFKSTLTALEDLGGFPEKNFCSFFDWRNVKACCDLYGIFNGISVYYKCDHKRVDIFIKDPTLRFGLNNLITGYQEPIRYPIYRPNFVPAFGGGFVFGQVHGNILIYGNYTECPYDFLGLYSIRNGHFHWIFYAADSVGDEYYLELAVGGDPNIPEPGVVHENGSELDYGTENQLGLGEWDWAEVEDSTGSFYTIIVKLIDGTDPNTKALHYLEAGNKKSCGIWAKHSV